MATIFQSILSTCNCFIHFNYFRDTNDDLPILRYVGTKFEQLTLFSETVEHKKELFFTKNTTQFHVKI